MLRKALTVLVTNLLILGLCATAAPNVPEEQGSAQERKTSVLRLGVGTRVEVRLQDRTKLTGFILEAKNDTFQVIEEKTGKTRSIRYVDVAEVKQKGRFPTRRIVEGVFIGVGGVAVILTSDGY